MTIDELHIELARQANELVMNSSDVRSLLLKVETLEDDVKHLLNTCVPIEELNEANERIVILEKENQELKTLIALAAHQ